MLPQRLPVSTRATRSVAPPAIIRRRLAATTEICRTIATERTPPVRRRRVLTSAELTQVLKALEVNLLSYRLAIASAIAGEDLFASERTFEKLGLKELSGNKLNLRLTEGFSHD